MISHEDMKPIEHVMLHWICVPFHLISDQTRGGGGAILRGGTFGGTALLVKRRNSKWSFTNEPEVSFRFRFYILIKVGPTVRPGVTSRLAKCPGISLQ